jgi:hypothetical protein
LAQIIIDLPPQTTRVVIREITCKGECQHKVDVYVGAVRRRYPVTAEQSAALHERLHREGWVVMETLYPRGGTMTYYGRHGA